MTTQKHSTQITHTQSLYEPYVGIKHHTQIHLWNAMVHNFQAIKDKNIKLV